MDMPLASAPEALEHNHLSMYALACAFCARRICAPLCASPG
jgi:hypothetical protein